MQLSIMQVIHGAEGACSASAEQTDEPWDLCGFLLCPCFSLIGQSALVQDGEQKTILSLLQPYGGDEGSHCSLWGKGGGQSAEASSPCNCDW